MAKEQPIYFADKSPLIRVLRLFRPGCVSRSVPSSNLAILSPATEALFSGGWGNSGNVVRRFSVGLPLA